MGMFPSSFDKNYILVVVDYVSKWIEAVAIPTNDDKVVVEFMRANIFARFGVPRELPSDEGTHFLNLLMENLLRKYSVKQKITTLYHPQTSGKVRVKEFTDGRIVNMMQALDAGWIVEHPRRATQAKKVPNTEERPTETSGPRRPQLQHLHLGVPLIDEDSQAHMDQMSML
ncbi:uncharacterized protein LOC127123851 [Lathyrus oleraceus]|uniref:uncharacterized protein LOC127123851 n=1 Tax=Pisum sativum TaxID=3888 RepID=UPI0021D1468A|nr:uncharacterized protein LOC127123851 [Pisum sativum]